MRQAFLNSGTNICTGSFELYIGERRGEQVYLAKSLELEMLESPNCCSEPTAKLERSQCQQLIDSLWNAGYRPSNGVASTGQIEATNKHLNDMRKIVSIKLKCDLG